MNEMLKHQYHLYKKLKYNQNKSKYEKLKLFMFHININSIILICSVFLITQIFNIKHLFITALISAIMLITILSFILETLTHFFIKEQYHFYLLLRLPINLMFITVWLSFLYQYFIQQGMEIFFEFSPRLSLFVFSIICNIIFSLLLSIIIFSIILCFEKLNLKLQILYIVKYFLICFILSGFFLMMLFKDYNFFITNASSELIQQISDDVFNKYTELLLVLFISQFFIPKINNQIKKFKNENH